jgi:hypothetical protein
MFFKLSLPSNPMLVDTGKAYNCHIQRRKTRRGKDSIHLWLLADGGGKRWVWFNSNVGIIVKTSLRVLGPCLGKSAAKMISKKWVANKLKFFLCKFFFR